MIEFRWCTVGQCTCRRDRRRKIGIERDASQSRGEQKHNQIRENGNQLNEPLMIDGRAGGNILVRWTFEKIRK